MVLKFIFFSLYLISGLLLGLTLSSSDQPPSACLSRPLPHMRHVTTMSSLPGSSVGTPSQGSSASHISTPSHPGVSSATGMRCLSSFHRLFVFIFTLTLLVAMLPPPLPAPIFDTPSSGLDEEIEVVDQPPYLKRRREGTDLPPSKASKGTASSDTSSVHRSDAGASAGTIVIPPSTIRPSEKSKGKAKEGLVKSKGRVKPTPGSASPDKPSSHATPKTNREPSNVFIFIFLFLIYFILAILIRDYGVMAGAPFLKVVPELFAVARQANLVCRFS